MTMMKKAVFAAALLTGAVAAIPANAATIMATYDFIGTFDSGPIPTISGTLSLTFDPTGDGEVTIDSFTSSYSGVSTVEGGSGSYTFCSAGPFGTCSFRPDTDAFLLGLSVDENGNPVEEGRGILYTAVGEDDVFISSTYIVTRQMTSAVPEPATWAMMLVGFGGIGFAMRRRRSQGAARISYAV